MVDINEIRRQTIALHGLTKADEVYTIYYDETNNIRRLHIRDSGLNVKNPKCFVVGGIAHSGPARNLKIEELYLALNLQNTIKELKLKHVATGDFLNLLRSKKMGIFLQWVLDQKLLIHYSALDPLYWSTVDVIDSILAEYGDSTLFQHGLALKNDLYTILRDDQDIAIDIFQRYSYPNVGRERRSAFITELQNLLIGQRELLPRFNFMMLKGILEIAEKLDALPFLEGETSNLLIDGFAPFFMGRIYILKNSQHVFDIEKTVETYIKNSDMLDGDIPLNNFSFADSVDEPGVQISDVVTGLLGKFFTFLSDSNIPEQANLNSQQQQNLKLLRELLCGSLEENAIFVHSILPLKDIQKLENFRNSSSTL